MKVYVYKDEMYPYYGIDTSKGKVEIPDELYQRYLTVEMENNAVQAELAKYSCE